MTPTVYDAILARRTIRRFKQKPVSFAMLEKCVNAARLAPSAVNRQSLEYIIVDEPAKLDLIFGAVRWAGYLKPRWAPAIDERPPAYIVLVAEGLAKGDLAFDAGMAVENILLAAFEEGLGSCCLGSAEQEAIRAALGVPESHSVVFVIALGYPNESPIVDDFVDSVEYWRDEEGALHVPKKSLADIIHRGSFGKRSADS